MKAASALMLVFLLVSVAAMTIEKRLKKYCAPKCKIANDTNWYQVGCYCVKHFQGSVDFGTAETKCQKEAPGGHLVSLHSEQENRAVHCIIMENSNASSSRTWIGGLQIPSTKTYIWTDRSLWNYEVWVPGEPNEAKGQEHCLEMSWKENEKWNDVYCLENLGYVCAKPQAATEGGGQE